MISLLTIQITRCTRHFPRKVSRAVGLSAISGFSIYNVHVAQRVWPNRWRPSIKNIWHILDTRSETRARLIPHHTAPIYIVPFLSPPIQNEARANFDLLGV